MRHLKKIFESTKKSQLEEVEDIFQELIDDKTFHDGEYYSNCDVYEENNSIMVDISDYEPEMIINSTSDYEDFIKSSELRIEKIKTLKKYLQRLDYDGFTWDMGIDNEGYHINVQYKENKLTLVDVFGGEFGRGRVNDNIAKRVFKDQYNLTFTRSSYREATSGYYGNRAVSYIYFKEILSRDNKLIKDLEKLEQKYKYFSTHAEGEQVRSERTFYSIEVNNTYIKLEIR